MRPLSMWPALRGALPPHTAAFERGVWGKAHGAASDFRWIGRSAGFARDRADLPVQLSLDREDAPTCFPAWRTLGDCCYAVAGYPSRAIDATGRRGFLEKQVLEWRRPPHVPAALGALLLLPRVASFTDDVWWERRGSEFWMDPDACLSLTSEEVAVDEETIGAALERGLDQLRETVDPESLARLYDQLLSGRRPALLAGVRLPLSAEALAALLLPLPREIADGLSLAGWIPAERPSPAAMGNRWDVLAVPAAPAATFDPATEFHARRMAEALLSRATKLLSAEIEEPAEILPPPELPEITMVFPRLEKPALRLKLPTPPIDAPPFLQELHAFAASADRRWLTSGSLTARRPSKLDPSYASLFAAWIEELRKQRPAWAHLEQWSAKIDVLRSAAIAFSPGPTVLHVVGLPNDTSRVPALLFGPLLETRDSDSLISLGKEGLRQVLTQTARCAAPQSIWSPIHDWLRRWQLRRSYSGMNVETLIGDALRLRPH